MSRERIHTGVGSHHDMVCTNVPPHSCLVQLQDGRQLPALMQAGVGFCRARPAFILLLSLGPTQQQQQQQHQGRVGYGTIWPCALLMFTVCSSKQARHAAGPVSARHHGPACGYCRSHAYSRCIC